ncbi:MAG: hypothetical protein HZC15_07250 [Candidatus Omnitrophica bacterium]|nr:hypothetical protein [Candidatus Omnitrophota bacterium]
MNKAIQEEARIMQRGRAVLFFTVFIFLCVFIVGCGKPKLASKWRDCEISIDGESDEWKDALAYYDENTRVNIGVMNDGTYLYICLITRNHGLMKQLTRSGFTVWFDPKGANSKVLGIRFPYGVGMRDQGMSPIERGDSDMAPSDKKGPEEPLKMLREPWQEVEIIGPGKEERYKTTVEAAEKYGISVKLGKSKGYFVYELKVPLFESEQHPYAIGVNKNKLIGLGFETAVMNKGMIRGMGSPGGRGGGMPGGSGGMPFGGGGMGGPGGGGDEMPEEEKSFQLWLIVMLSYRHSAIP